MYPKHHLFLHLCEIGLQQHGNPRKIWCYGDEDELGSLIDIAESVHCKYVHREVINKYRL